MSASSSMLWPIRKRLFRSAEKQDLLKKQIEELQQKLNADKEKDRTLEKRLGAWEYYKRACEIKRQLDLSMQVKMFPTNGKDKWNEIMNRMKSIHDQKESLQAKLDEYTPIEKRKSFPGRAWQTNLKSSM